MHDLPHHPEQSAQDGFFDGSADDLGHGRLNHFSRSSRRSGRHDLSRAPSWVKVLVWVGALLAIAGVGVIGFGIVTSLDGPEPSSTLMTPAFPTADLPAGFPPGEFSDDFPAAGFPAQPQRPSLGVPDLGLGFGLFFAGFVLTAIGALGHSTSRQR